MPGHTISFGSVIEDFARMDRPSFNHIELKGRLKRICEFIQHVLEKSSVSIEVTAAKDTILVSIDGILLPLSNLGTGVEQLLMLGLASFGFPGRLVLIDELELHFHPRAQKRILTYLNNISDVQFVIATHSAACLDAVEADIIQVAEINGRSIGRTVKTNRDKFEAVRDLGHSLSELIQTRYAIWVEGPSDRMYLVKWISRLNAGLVEGVDYSILFYGGRVLSHHGFDDVEDDLVKALSLSRNFAIVIDSDRPSRSGRLNATKKRVRDEVDRQGGLRWITNGREVENYIPELVVELLRSKFPHARRAKSKFEKIIDSDKVNKVAFARAACEPDWPEWPLDLMKRMRDLVNRILAAR